MTLLFVKAMCMGQCWWIWSDATQSTCSPLAMPIPSQPSFAHPGIEVIARDRSTEYARGATEGAPDAVQVVDRWHLIGNLRDVLERMPDRLWLLSWALYLLYLHSSPRILRPPQSRLDSTDG
jgi:hypothetical protein